jgi:hypothetical protein
LLTDGYDDTYHQSYKAAEKGVRGFASIGDLPDSRMEI